MNFVEAIHIALQSLWANKLRSALTLLGVVIGVAAVIAVVTFVNGINGYVAEKIFNLGADVFIVFKVSPAVTNVDHFLEGEKRKDLTMDDYAAAAEACQHCAYIGAALRNSSGHVKYGLQEIKDTTVHGMTPAMAVIYDIDLATGRMLNETDLENKSSVAVVGPDVVDNLMPGLDPMVLARGRVRLSVRASITTSWSRSRRISNSTASTTILSASPARPSVSARR
jgi:putative ABC transport system permease protein